MMSMLKLNLPEILLIVALFLYALKLLRSNRISTQMGVRWLLGLILVGLLCLSSGRVAHILAGVGRGDPLRGMAVLGVAWLAFLALNTHARISALTVKLKLLDQELALMSERLHRAETRGDPAGPTNPDATIHSRPDVNSLKEAPPKSVGASGKSIVQQIVACAWVGLVVYAFGLFTGDFTAQNTLTQTLASFIDTLHADYLQ